ncbi:MAG TPA: hypothetical protein VG890_03355 [Puia sp.]|nr:hypothetical protein [Puia sp.]
MDQPPLDLSGISESNIPRPDKRAEKEEGYLLRKMDRENKMEATIHLCKRALLVVSFLVIIAFILIRVFVLVVPECWVWLTSDQITKLDEFFVHGTIGAIVAAYLGKYFKEK